MLTTDAVAYKETKQKRFTETTTNKMLRTDAVAYNLNMERTHDKSSSRKGASNKATRKETKQRQLTETLLVATHNQ